MNRSTTQASDRSTTGIDFLRLDLADAPRGGLSAWLAARIREAIAQGALQAGTRLPASRDLAADLGVSRGVVTEGYRRLAEGGYVVARGRAGTVVAPRPSAVHPRGARVGATPSVRFEAPDLGVFDALRSSKARIDLTPGVPDLASFPRSAWLRSERAVLDDLPSGGLGYAEPAGVPVFRAAVASWLARYRGIGARADEVVVVAGVAQALAILARVLPDHGIDRIAVEDPGSFGARRHLEAWGMSTTPVVVDEHGLDVAALVADGAPAALVTPAHQFPTGVVLGGARRRELLEWAAAGGMVIEDDYDAEHRYDRAPVTALRAATGEQICYTGSLSKTLAPSLRVGWLLVPDHLRARVVTAKRDLDLGNATLPQLTLARLMDSGDLERHLRSIRTRHRRRRDAMVAAIRTHSPGWQVHGSAAGLHLTVTYDGPPGSDVEVARAALDLGVKVHPLSWHRSAGGPPGLVLGYAASTPAQIEAGIALLSTTTLR
ncbi:MocR-like pyridoxine biosynthesis transcription factor PdxR [Nocardioides sp. T2.26MG-1]|uniref:MocR-like pyridoxine biosynthesis transcription factor PdxR n=1 Tax=Nocardioides sp. T2.26MG-1 TaxID=3041166 RepID=UPI002540875F|nr:PLP-dependent aminotransferase family protein [Nocardioides sp. T2.26MG-1]